MIRKSTRFNWPLLATALFLPIMARAGNLTWTGASNTLWNMTDANWSGDGTVFVNGDAVLFSNTTGVITGIVSRSRNCSKYNSI